MSVLVATSPVHMHAHTSPNDRAFDINTLDSSKRQKPNPKDDEQITNVVDYLNKKDILWQPCPIQIIKNTDGTFKKTPRYVCFPNNNNGFMPKHGSSKFLKNRKRMDARKQTPATARETRRERRVR